MKPTHNQWARLLAAIALFIVATNGAPADAQVQQGITPEIGAETTVPIGEPLLMEYRFRGMPGITLGEDIQMSFVANQVVQLPKGSVLAIIRLKRVKACQSRSTLGWDICVMDLDGDGKIEKVALNDVSGAKNVNPPVPYELSPVKVGVIYRLGEGADFKKVFVFTGVSDGNLLVSYREFLNDFARPAFSDAYSIPLSNQFPQLIAIKDHLVQVLGVDGLGLRYKVIR